TYRQCQRRHRNNNQIEEKQGRIHGRTVADGWGGAVKRKPLGIQKCDRRTYGRTDVRTDGLTYRPTRQDVESCFRD
ncbi:MAG: hypothetical protein VX367_06165, partial [SAR324 cluster bacterium]|nr:hypothetical protein [SAR324 cluster bacterium]